MSDDDYSSGIVDHEYERTQQEQSPEEEPFVDQALEDVRKALYAVVTITVGGQPQTTTVFNAITDSMTRAAAKSDTNAVKQRDHLDRHRAKQRDLANAQSRRANSPVRELERKHNVVLDFINPIGTVIALRMLPCIVGEFEKVYGPITLSTKDLPFYLDVKPTLRELSRLQRRQRRKQPKVEYKVGFKKPPLANRFTAENNPRRQVKAADPWTHYDRSQRRAVTVTLAQGKAVTTTWRELSFTQLFRNAMRGNPSAGSESIKLIIHLDEKGMLSSPERTHRCKRKPAKVSKTRRMMLKVAEVMLTPGLKRDMVEALTRRYGPVDDFVTAHERGLPALHKIEGWSEFTADRTERKAATQAAKSDESVTAVETRPIIPTRPRTRASPMSRTSGSPTAPASSASAAGSTPPRAKVPVIKPRKPAASGNKPKR